MSNFNPQQLTALANKFVIQGDVIDVIPFGSGHINDTYRVRTAQQQARDYLLQRINHRVFGDVPSLMQNIAIVTQQLKRKYEAIGGNGRSLADRVLTLIPTHTGLAYHQDSEGNFWRMFILLADTRSYDIVETPQQAREGGRAFGQFQRLLADLDVTLIHEVLPDFHHIGRRLAKLHQAIAADPVNRVRRVEEELMFVKAREKRMHTILQRAAEGQLPLRIIHNDTKFNNVLLDVHDRAQCVIDLDTVMPGYVAYDFGDAIRTIINSAAEDEADLSSITLNIPLFEAYTAGYFEEAHAFLVREEINSLMEGVLLLPYMQAVRFLTDFLEGDHYYKVHHADHNLQRARAQIKLVELLEIHEPELRNSIDQLAKHTI
ncbi:phosphotransferase enzyme family protein [Parapedobacter koreensis]|uniref:Phosphotransferase enzyme family protein n=1 Tax=Parapedobacter koreensis TaxID=332977 RepID=A0A1H7I6B4_9SPHI|nr:aminoglycoside phosphotransferase family protein [Parapedobacter koreensis]SEK58081.1 Phosphotransferase enzyme family protein [Parapedobacter koreensis]